MLVPHDPIPVDALLDYTLQQLRDSGEYSDTDDVELMLTAVCICFLTATGISQDLSERGDGLTSDEINRIAWTPFDKIRRLAAFRLASMLSHHAEPSVN